VPAVEVRSWIPVVGAGAEHVPDGGEDCPFDRDDGFEFSAAGGDASVLGAQVGVALSGCRHGGGANGGFYLAAFRTPVADPLGEALAGNPRFIVVANPLTRDPKWLPHLRARVDRAVNFVARHYRVVETVNGERDSFTIYEFRD